MSKVMYYLISLGNRNYLYAFLLCASRINNAPTVGAIAWSQVLGPSLSSVACFLTALSLWAPEPNRADVGSSQELYH